jgi:hypothetical protein
MSDQLYEALEACLQAMEAGGDIESRLARFPQLADELRPLLTTAATMQAAAVTDIPDDAMRRGRARLLRRAAELREESAASRQRWLLNRAFRLAALALAVVVLMVAGGTGLVRASSSSLPGDNLYTVKRTWEDIRLWFVFSPQERETLEDEYDQERVEEVNGLFSKGREVTVTFRGVIAEQVATGNTTARWVVDGIQVDFVGGETRLEGDPASLMIGSPVEITGTTQPGGVIKAKVITAVQGINLPAISREPAKSAEPGGREPAEKSGTPGTEGIDAPSSGKNEPDSEGSQALSTPHPAKDRSDSDGDDGGGD